MLWQIASIERWERGRPQTRRQARNCLGLTNIRAARSSAGAGARAPIIHLLFSTNLFDTSYC
jgi:hypothetical protein